MAAGFGSCGLFRVAAPRRFGCGQRPGQPGQKWEVFHPPVRKDLRCLPAQRARLSPFGRYLPKNFQLQSQLEAVRSGEYLGPDWPYNYLGMPMWAHRRYNVSYHDIPVDESGEIGVQFHRSVDLWKVQWHEKGRHRQRAFRAQFNFMEAKYKCEQFRRLLEATGRVDNRMTARHRVVVDEQKEKMQRLKRKLMNREMHIRRKGKQGNTLRGKWAYLPKGEAPGLRKKYGAHYPKWD